MILQFLNAIEKDFDLKKLCRCGVIKATDVRDREIYLKFDSLRTSGKKRNDCIYILCAETNLSFETIRNAIRKMKG